LVTQSWVYGDSLRDYTIGIIVPNEETLRTAAKSELHVEGSLEELIKRDDVREFVLRALGDTAAKGNLKGFEKVRKIYLEAEHFTPENGLLTPTFKMKRIQAKEKYEKVIMELYGTQ